MKPIEIDFVRRSQWKKIWLFATLICTLILGSGVFRWVDKQREIDDGVRYIQTQKRQLDKLEKTSTSSVDPRHASLQLAEIRMRQDLNVVFAAAENLRIEGVHLTNMTIDANSDSLQLEYELQALEQVTMVTEFLNSGFEKRPWSLIGMTSSYVTTQQSSATSLIAPMPGKSLQTQESMRANWSVKLSALWE